MRHCTSPHQGRLLLWAGDTVRDSSGRSPPSLASSFLMGNGRLLVPGGQIPPMHSPGREPFTPRMHHKTILLLWGKRLHIPKSKMQPLGWAKQAHGVLLHMVGFCVSQCIAPNTSPWDAGHALLVKQVPEPGHRRVGTSAVCCHQRERILALSLTQQLLRHCPGAPRCSRLCTLSPLHSGGA